MMEVKTLDSLCLKITDGAHHSPKEFQGGIPMFSVKDMTDHGFDKSRVKTISKEDYKKLKSSGCEPKDNDVLIAKDGSVMKHVFKYKHYEDCALLSSIAILRPNMEIIDPDYLVYSILNPKVKGNIISNYVSGSGVPRIVLKDFKKIEIKVPEIRIQKKVSQFLNQINSKIELNQKMNETLEEIAKTLFKSWFIDFDPVRAKAEGRSTGLSKEISDLFPDSFQDSELGEIPKGWSKRVITDIADKISDKYKKDEDWSNEKLIDLSRMPSNSISLNSYGRGEELSTSVCKFKKYDFLFGSIRPYFYKAGICPYDGVSNTSVFILRAKKIYDKEFMYCYSSSDFTFEKSIQYSDGTKMPIIKWKDFKEFPFALPNEELRKQFSSIINPIVDKIILNIDEQEVLSKLRDLLLPKLISGELQIPDAENLIEEAGS